MAKHAGVGGPTFPPTPIRDHSARTSSNRPKHAASGGGGIPRVVGVAVLAVVAGLAAATFVIISGLNPLPDRAAAEAPVASAGPAETGSTTAATQSPTSAPATVGSVLARLTGRPPAALPQAGPGLTQPGILLIASPASDGSFDVLERIRLTSPVTVLTLRPAPVARAGHQFGSASAAATEIQIGAGAETVAVPGAKIDGSTNLPVPASDQFELRYRLTDVTVRSTPSTAGRALAVIGPLTDGGDDDLPVLFVVTGDTILGLYCPLLPLTQQSCGSRVQDEPSVERELPWRLALTSVQFNLPPA